MPKITKRVVDATGPDPSGKRLVVWDTEIIGFGLLVLPSGVKSYFFRYRTREGRERRMTIGKHGTYTPEEARNKADDLRRDVKDGRDPLAAKDALRHAATVGEILDAYLKSAKFKSKAESTQAIDRGRIERHLRPLLGKRHAHAVTAGDVETAMAEIRDGKTAALVKTKARGLARVTGGEGTARMAIELLRSVFTWAVRERLLAANPCADIRTGSSGTRETILEDEAAYTRLFKTLEAMERELAIRGPVADAIRLIALTGARRGEVAGLRWSHVDLKRGVITLPPAAHKTGRRTGKPRVIGLPSPAQAIIARQPHGKPDAYVFAPSDGKKVSAADKGPIALSKPWRSVRVRAGLPDGIGLHGLRHSLATHMAMSGAEAAEIMTALGHRQLSTAQRYVHWSQDGRQALAEKAAATAIAGLAGTVSPPAAVTTLKRTSRKGRDDG
jgi:integrase